MGRNVSSLGIILKAARVGEIHKSITLLTPDLGIISAIAHGAYKGKSKLSGSTDVFSASFFYLYFDPVKNSYKVTDVEHRDIFNRLRDDISRYYSASLCTEVIFRTFAGGGDYSATFALLFRTLSLLDARPKDELSWALIIFLYKYIDALGYLPEIDTCSRCGRSIPETETVRLAGEGVFICRDCAGGNISGITPGARRYLLYIRAHSVDESIKIKLDGRSTDGLKTAFLSLIQHIIGSPLNSLKGARGIV